MKANKFNISFGHITSFFREFLFSQQIGGFLVIACSVISLILANSTWKDAYIAMWHQLVHVSFGSFHLTGSREFIINEVLMSVFFLLVGLEIRREATDGELSKPGQAMLPVFAAAGGMLVPALVFSVFNLGTPYQNGWGIPMATDIAFALAVLSMLGKRIPNALKIFLTALAVADDLGAIVVIGVFYSDDLNVYYLGGLILLLGLLFAYGKSRRNSLWVILPSAVLLWILTYKSGIHATVSGVLLAMVVPSFQPQPGEALTRKMEHRLHTPVNFFIMPLFAMANTSMVIDMAELRQFPQELIMGIVAGLYLGKPAGILLACYFLHLFKKISFPKGINWANLAGAGFLGGIGFTMSVFVTLLAYQEPLYVNAARISIIFASLLSAFTGLLLLYFAHRR